VNFSWACGRVDDANGVDSVSGLFKCDAADRMPLYRNVNRTR
jgi:hypothetical protein